MTIMDNEKMEIVGDSIRELYITNPMVMVCLNFYLSDKMTYQQALEGMVWRLSDENQRLKKSLIQCFENSVKLNFPDIK